MAEYRLAIYLRRSMLWCEPAGDVFGPLVTFNTRNSQVEVMKEFYTAISGQEFTGFIVRDRTGAERYLVLRKEDIAYAIADPLPARA